MADLGGQFGDAARLIARRWWLVIGLAALAAGLAIAYQAAIASTVGSAEARIGFGIDPEFYDILPNQRRIETYVASEEFATALSAVTGEVEVDVVLPNGIQAFADVRVRHAESDAAALDIADEAARLVVQRMDDYYASGSRDDSDERSALLSKLEELAAEELDLRADEARLRDIQSRTVLVRFEDEGAFGEYEAAATERSSVLQRITAVVIRQGDIERELLDLDRISQPRRFEVLTAAAATSRASSERPLPVIAAVAGAALGLLLALGGDRSNLPIRAATGLERLNLGADTLVAEDSLRPVALLIDRRLDSGQRVAFIGFGIDPAAALSRVHSVLGLLGTASVVVDPDAHSAPTEVGLVNGGSGDSGVAEVTRSAHGAVLLVGRGTRRPSKLQPAVSELNALGVELLAVVLVDTATV
ncbi:MAG: hypothetical protein V3V01_13815 [Acidimicrobiales bacterium]